MKKVFSGDIACWYQTYKLYCAFSLIKNVFIFGVCNKGDRDYELTCMNYASEHGHDIWIMEPIYLLLPRRVSDGSSRNLILLLSVELFTRVHTVRKCQEKSGFQGSEVRKNTNLKKVRKSQDFRVLSQEKSGFLLFSDILS